MVFKRLTMTQGSCIILTLRNNELQKRKLETAQQFCTKGSGSETKPESTKLLQIKAGIILEAS